MQARAVQGLNTSSNGAPTDLWCHRRLDGANLARHFARRGRTTEALTELGKPGLLEWNQGKRQGVGLRSLLENLGVALVMVTAPVRFATLWDWRAALEFAASCIDNAFESMFAADTLDPEWLGYPVSVGMCASARAIAVGNVRLSTLSAWLPAIVIVERYDIAKLMLVSAMRELAQATHDPMMPAEVARYCRLAHAANEEQAMSSAPTPAQLGLLSDGLGYPPTTREAIARSTT